MTNQESTFQQPPKWVIDRPLMDAIVLAIATDQKENPTLPALPKQVEAIANACYDTEEMLYYLDTEDTDVTIEHIREGATKLAAKVIRFLQSLPMENAKKDYDGQVTLKNGLVLNYRLESSENEGE